MSVMKPVFLALSMLLVAPTIVAPVIVHAEEITLVPAVKLQIGDRDDRGYYWDGGNWRDHDWWGRHYEWRDNRWHPHDEYRHHGHGDDNDQGDHHDHGHGHAYGHDRD
ncbi:DUF2502 domain-containing protein [Yokenella regensburgei]|uniref:Protein of uncharacterized function (DUF2502) n=1 Tax=Yokenella regensburgei TaxID=158877 RepID=A0AB38FVV8_9ENTR|nr:DUF2502 domain-containing protein [Yokenella regensburgei]EHM51158.1 hypothetical protein HMPREF0880_00537 [Yokenella regensburgei ATCC 43003]KAF1370857.1 hypothetical protein FHR25_000952 [Yokenella regensburgei]KFD25458.1 hypothetical protein GYRE_00189 [Yokenella regensburgei ATCC 49455]MDQ4429362.1 DUF2502 domain-containing protein [Yokenella regensburgei]QIU91658.1 DUF2502 domain-containing protein [Yokenella regensburgei]